MNTGYTHVQRRWTRADEAKLQELAQRRAEIMNDNREAVVVVVKHAIQQLDGREVSGGVEVFASAWVDQLIANADALLTVLAPFASEPEAPPITRVPLAPR